MTTSTAKKKDIPGFRKMSRIREKLRSIPSPARSSFRTIIHLLMS
jgi:hypothetical protein